MAVMGEVHGWTANNARVMKYVICILVLCSLVVFTSGTMIFRHFYFRFFSIVLNASHVY